MKKFYCRFMANLTPDRGGMEMVQVAILIAIAITIGLIFSKQINAFVSKTFRGLSNADF